MKSVLVIEGQVSITLEFYYFSFFFFGEGSSKLQFES